MREIVEPAVDHGQRVAEVLLTVLASSQIGEVGGGSGTVRRRIIFVEAGGGGAERELVRHDGPIR